MKTAFALVLGLILALSYSLAYMDITIISAPANNSNISLHEQVTFKAATSCNESFLHCEGTLNGGLSSIYYPANDTPMTVDILPSLIVEGLNTYTLECTQTNCTAQTSYNWYYSSWQPTYSTDDLPSATIDVIAKIFIIIGLFTFVIVLAMLGTWAMNKIKVK